MVIIGRPPQSFDDDDACRYLKTFQQQRKALQERDAELQSLPQGLQSLGDQLIPQLRTGLQSFVTGDSGSQRSPATRVTETTGSAVAGTLSASRQQNADAQAFLSSWINWQASKLCGGFANELLAPLPEMYAPLSAIAAPALHQMREQARSLQDAQDAIKGR